VEVEPEKIQSRADQHFPGLWSLALFDLHVCLERGILVFLQELLVQMDGPEMK
jgi:hypothetical protein